ncbi:MAG TPA: hypothetical protein VF698_04865, partial [Thermoanaerobaculia bacterium]
MPNVRATVVTLRTTMQPQNRVLTHTIAIANGKARSSDELDYWRLFDLNRNEVTFVDDVEKTRRTMPFAALQQQRRELTGKPLDPNVTRASIAPTGKTQPLLNLQATQTVIRMHAYERQLWFATHPQIPAQLFALMHISNPPTSPMAPVMRDVDEHLTNVRGFPLSDRSELRYGDKDVVVERVVVSVAQQDVPRTTFEVP